MVTFPTITDAGPALRAEAFLAGPWPALVFSDDVLLAMNDAARDFFGAALSEGRPLRYTFAEEAAAPLLSLVVRALGRDAPVRERTLELSWLDGPVWVVDAVAMRLPDHPGVLVSLYPLTTDDLSAPGDALKNAAGLGRILAHEIKNPLAGIRGAAQLLRTNADSDDAALAQLIMDETDRIRRLLDQLESFSDSRTGEAQAVNIHRVLDRVRTLVATGAADKVRFTVVYDPSLPDALGDEDQLVQVFLNLVKNAAEAALLREDGDAEVTILTAYRHGVRAGPSADAPVTPLEVRVKDNGPGVPPELRRRLFDPFVTTKPQGTGLGLTLTAKLVAAHHGGLDFDSRPGRTVFRVLLPVAHDAPPAADTNERLTP